MKNTQKLQKGRFDHIIKKSSKNLLINQSVNRYYDFHYYNTANNTIIGDLEEINGAGGGGGSCFPAGTFVRTQTGYTLIENLVQGDVLLSYDRFGEIDYSIILKVNVHEFPDIRDDMFNFNNGVLICTGNHALYDYATNEHKLAHEFDVGDYLTNLNDEQILITRIDRNSCDNYVEGFKVYNFEVSPYHTYYVSTTCEVETGHAEWIKVHNGGGGGSKNTSRASVEAPNTLRSSAVVRVLEVLSEGEIVGVVGGLRGAYLNATPIQNADSSNNFSGVTFDQRVGLPSQTYIPGFSNIETEQSKNVAVTLATPSTQTVIGTGVHAARVTIFLPDGLWSQNTTNGDLNGHSVNYAIDVKPTASGTWTQVVNHTLSGKTTTSYEISHRVVAPAAGWDIRVRRISADDASASKKSSIKFQRWTEIQEILETYNNTAYVGLTVPAESVGNQIPTRGYDVQGIKCSIPTNYNPVSRVYTGAWDGTFKVDWTDNTAWIFYDLIANNRYGVATYLNQTLQIDKWEIYNSAVYNDGLVPDGKGGQEARFTFNSVIQSQSDAWQLLHAVASNMRAMPGMAGNLITLIQDRPTASTKIITNANVIEGTFTYSSVDSSSRITAVNVTFNDKNDNYLPRTISVENNTSGAAHTVNYGNGTNIWGYNVQDFAAFGNVTESYAVRMAKWILYTEAKQGDLVNFGLALNIIDLQVGNVVPLMDNDYVSTSNTYLAGRVNTVAGTTITLSCPVTLDTGFTYTIGFTNITNDGIIERTITSAAGTTSTITINTALPTGTYTNNEFYCYSSGHISPRLFKIVSIVETDHGKFSVNAQLYDALKWSVVETGLSIATTATSNVFSSPSVASPTNITMEVLTYNDNINGGLSDLMVKWQHTNPDILDFRIRWYRELNPWSSTSTVSTKDFLIKGISDGSYTVEVTAVRVDGKISLPTKATLNITGTTTPLLPPTSLYISGTTGLVFTTKDMGFTWVENATNSTFINARTSQYYIEIRRIADDSLVHSFFQDKAYTYYTYKYDDMVILKNVNRTQKIRVYAVDAMNRKSSTFAAATFSNAVPAVISMTVQSTDSTAYVNLMDSGTDDDIEGYVVHRSTTSAFAPAPANLIYDGPDRVHTFSVLPSTTYYYKTASYDRFDKVGLNYSSQYTNTSLSADAQYRFIYTGLNFTAAGNILSWSLGTVKVTYGGVTTAHAVAAGTVTWTAGDVYIIYVNGAVALTTTTNYSTALAFGSDTVAVYKGGNDLLVSNGKPIIDGNKIIAQSIGANQLSTGLLIAHAAQVGSAIINSGHIVNATIDTLQLKNGSVIKILTTANNFPLTLSAVNTTFKIYSPTFVTPVPVGIAGPFKTTIQFQAQQKAVLNVTGSAMQYYQSVDLQESSDNGTTWGYATVFLNSQRTNDQSIGGGVKGDYIQSVFTGTAYYYTYPNRLYRIEYQYDTFNHAANTYDANSSYYQGYILGLVTISLAG